MDTKGKPDEDENEPCSPGKDIGYDDDDTESDSSDKEEEESKMTEEEVNKMQVAAEEKVRNFSYPQFFHGEFSCGVIGSSHLIISSKLPLTTKVLDYSATQ